MDENSVSNERAAQQLLNASALLSPSHEIHSGFVKVINEQYAANGTHRQIAAWLAMSIHKGLTEGVWPNAVSDR